MTVDKNNIFSKTMLKFIIETKSVNTIPIPLSSQINISDPLLKVGTSSVNVRLYEPSDVASSDNLSVMKQLDNFDQSSESFEEAPHHKKFHNAFPINFIPRNL